jgi:hypothetical protein
MDLWPSPVPVGAETMGLTKEETEMTVSEIPAGRRTTARYFAAAMALLTALAYFLIGFRVLTVLENPEDQTVFGLIAGSAFLIGALVLLLTDSRVVMGLGAIAQALIILMYFNLAPEREPSFEVWGILIRVVQVLLLGALAYLAIRPRSEATPQVDAPSQGAVTAGQPPVRTGS